MRTTLDIDDVVLSAARGLAAAEGMSLGKAVSELALKGIRGPAEQVSTTVDYGWAGMVLLPSRPDDARTHSADELERIRREMDEEQDLAHERAGRE